MEATSRSRHGARFLHRKLLALTCHTALRKGRGRKNPGRPHARAPPSAPALGGFWHRLHLWGAGTPPALPGRVVPPQLSLPGPGVPVSRSQTPWLPRCVLGLWSQAAWRGWGDHSRDPSRPPAAALGRLGRTLLLALLSGDSALLRSPSLSQAVRPHGSAAPCRRVCPHPKPGFALRLPSDSKRKHNLFVVPTPSCPIPHAPSAQRPLLSLHLTPGEQWALAFPLLDDSVVPFLLPAPFPLPSPRLLLSAAEAQVLPQ